MRVSRTALLLGVVVAASGSDCGKWQTLFDGGNTANWEEVTGRPFPSHAWTIEDGCLRTVPSPDGVQDIRTIRTFHSFELMWEWKVSPGANSGVKYFIRRVDKWDSKTGPGYQARGRGSEYQIADDYGDPDAESTRTKSAASLYGKLAPATDKRLRPVGEFNQSKIVVRGAQVEHWLNGEKVLSYREPSPVDSPVVLQNHNSIVWFRNIRIRELCD
jgi:hypothetical protein